MWKCKHCECEFDFEETHKKANHSRWCSKNPKHKDTDSLKLAQQKSADRRYGKLTSFEVICDQCNSNFEVIERGKQFPKKNKYFCSRSCANSQGGQAKALLDEDNGDLSYRTLAMKYLEPKCVVCGFDTIVEVHHINEIHSDNRIENLVFLCPNHHRMYHSKHKDEIEPYITMHD